MQSAYTTGQVNTERINQRQHTKIEQPVYRLSKIFSIVSRLSSGLDTLARGQGA